jgi:serine/threonine protein kinase
MGANPHYENPVIESLSVSREERDEIKRAVDLYVKKNPKSVSLDSAVKKFKISKDILKVLLGFSPKDKDCIIKHSVILVLQDPPSLTRYKIGYVAVGKKPEEGVIGEGSEGVVKLVQYEDGMTELVKISKEHNKESNNRIILEKIREQLKILREAKEELSKLPQENQTDKSRQRISEIKEKIKIAENRAKEFLYQSITKTGKTVKYIKRIAGFNAAGYVDSDLYTALSNSDKYMLALSAALRIKELHDLHIMHRDVKLANFIFDLSNGKRNAVDIDHDMSLPFAKADEAIIEDYACGTLGYIAPEIYDKDSKVEFSKYYPAVDVYALGKMFGKEWSESGYFFVCMNLGWEEVEEEVKGTKYYYLKSVNAVSAELMRNLIEKMVDKNYALRPTMQQVVRNIKCLQFCAKLEENLSKNESDTRVLSTLYFLYRHIEEVESSEENLIVNAIDAVACENIQKLLMEYYDSKEKDKIKAEIAKKILFEMQKRKVCGSNEEILDNLPKELHDEINKQSESIVVSEEQKEIYKKLAELDEVFEGEKKKLDSPEAKDRLNTTYKRIKNFLVKCYISNEYVIDYDIKEATIGIVLEIMEYKKKYHEDDARCNRCCFAILENLPEKLRAYIKPAELTIMLNKYIEARPSEPLSSFWFTFWFNRHSQRERITNIKNELKDHEKCKNELSAIDFKALIPDRTNSILFNMRKNQIENRIGGRRLWFSSGINLEIFKKLPEELLKEACHKLGISKEEKEILMNENKREVAKKILAEKLIGYNTSPNYPKKSESALKNA